MKLENKTAVVTGAASGIGRETAVLFAKEGAKVVAIDLNLDGAQKTIERIKEETGRDALAIACDVSNSEKVQGVAKQIVQELGNVDVLVNCAGIETVGSILETPDDLWDKIFAVNVRGMFLVSKYLVPLMKKGSSIVNLGSTASVRAFRRLAAYTTSKGAVLLLSRSMAVDLADLGIRVNCVCPGTTKTAMADRLKGNDPNWEQVRIEKLLVGRLGTPVEIANVVLFLASDDASFVNGAPLLVDGGLTAW